jgi:hypothetical protein
VRDGTGRLRHGNSMGLLALLCLLLASLVVTAAEPRPTQLDLVVAADSLTGEWKMLLSELAALQLDADGNGEATWPEIEHRQQDIEAYLNENLAVVANGGLAGMRFEHLLYGTQLGEPAILAQLHFDAQPDLTRLEVDLGRFAGRIAVRWPDGGQNKREVAAGAGSHEFTLEGALRGGFLEFLWQGIWHIWIGFDHILFLLVLLLPAVFRRTEAGREAVPRFGTALRQVLMIVSAFTVAHSITLTCAAMGWIKLPSRLVESAIAASVLLAALTNFLPRAAGGRGAWLAFGFGLLHGFGFANALGELAPAAGHVGLALLAFNIGVELGQLAIVAVFLPVAFLLRRTAFYRLGALYGGSAAIGVVALRWLLQRALPA